MNIRAFSRSASHAGFGLCLGALVLACGSGEKTAGPTPPLVKVIKTSESGADALELRGSVAPQGRSNLGFKLSGVISSIRVRDGERVRAGQVLAVLNEVDALAQVRTARAALDRARREAEQAERLVQEGILPRNQRDDSRNQLESCEALWRQAQDSLGRTRLTSPIAGTVFRRLAEPGETVAAGTPVLVVDTTNQLVVKTGVGERDLKRLAVGQEAELIPEDGGKPFPGIVKHLGASPNASDGLYLVELAPSRADLQPGSLLKIRLSCPGSGGMRVPFSALVHRQEQDSVFVVNGDGKAVQARPVRVVKADGSVVVIAQGLRLGERVVAEGAFYLEDGQAVRILE
jgi:RND family efflux transporter MFP subunit